MTKAEILNWLKGKLDPGLYNHAISTQEMAVELADIYNIDRQKAILAGLLHDCAKPLSHQELLLYAKRFDIPLDCIRLAQPGLLHAPVGAKIAEAELGIIDSEILHAISFHNTGSPEMTGLDKVLYLADSAETSRNYPGVQLIRDLSYSGKLDEALLKAMEIKILHVINKRAMLHPLTVEARNDVLRQIKERE